MKSASSVTLSSRSVAPMASVSSAVQVVGSAGTPTVRLVMFAKMHSVRSCHFSLGTE